MPRVGIVTGLPDEADAFRWGDGTREAHSFYLRNHDDFAIACAGIGKVNAATAASALVERGCTLLFSLGTAGGIGAHGGAYWLTHAIQHDYGARRADGFHAFTPGALPFGPAHLDAYAAIPDPGSELPHARILSGDTFVEDADAAAALAQCHDAHLVDMETGAIAQVAATHGIGWAGIRAVSDGADNDSAATFQDNLERAARDAARAAERILPLLK